MREHNNYKKSTVIFSLLLLGQALPLYATETPDAISGTDASFSSPVNNLENELVKDAPVKPIDNEEDANYFDILEFQVEGNTKLTAEKIEAAVYPLMGERKTIADVEKARESLEKTYHEAGFLTVLVDIPEQDVDKKIVKLNVTEGKVGRLRVKDSDYYSLGRIKTLAPSVKEGEIPHFPTVQKDIARLNRTSDKRVTPVMKAGKNFGTVDVDLKVEDTLPVHANLELNDRYSQDTSRLRLSGMIKYDNLWQREHSLSLNFLTSPENTDEVKVISANYLMRFDESDALMAFYGVSSKSSVATVGGINILGDGNILGVRLIKPLPSVDNYYHSISLGLDYKDFGQTVVFGGSFDTPITYAPLSASYNGTWQEGVTTTQINTGAIFGLRGVVSEASEFTAKRVGAKPNFFVAKADLQRTQNLPFGFQGFAKVDGQFSGSPLISNEQYLAGGVDTVRGYLEAEASGDQGLHSTLEIRTPTLFRSVSWVQDFRLSAFYDISQLRTIDPTEGQDRTSVLSGAGMGLKVNTSKGFNINLDFAWPLKDSLATKKGDFRSHMRVWYEF
ncbi:ShlB/FhaC/HecB family hemolysin secretion/activation protein [Methylotenera sp. L2L1]|uniref:ShlB/FhaC/HecB family hemolysin secretion/activation protein n=1 Tax=Methylotenera sp. L2L1 TaxID=1502770 RepID=UPI0006895155|nr:ShlB/FhaC/HecB family hemolysin secretion/activation protein [Methylotenera sp. L2L1]